MHIAHMLLSVQLRHAGAHFIKQQNSALCVMICHSCNLISVSHLFLLRTAEWEDWGL